MRCLTDNAFQRSLTVANALESLKNAAAGVIGNKNSDGAARLLERNA